MVLMEGVVVLLLMIFILSGIKGMVVGSLFLQAVRVLVFGLMDKVL